MNRRHNQIGLDRLIRLEWLERTASLALAETDASVIQDALLEHLQGSFRSSNMNVRGSLDKTITILKRIWLRPPDDLSPLQQAGLHLLRQVPKKKHLAVHWGMTMAVYPFWGAVAAHAGRLLRLQGRVVAGQVQRRVREQYGERETVSRRVRYVLRSYIDWNVLQETPTKGIYSQGVVHPIKQVELAAWLVEALLHANRGGPIALAELLYSPSLFPFQFGVVSANSLVLASDRLDVLQHGLDQQMIMLRS